MARTPDKQQTARVLCTQRRITVVEHQSGAVHFRGGDVDLLIACWNDLDLRALTPEFERARVRHERHERR